MLGLVTYIGVIGCASKDAQSPSFTLSFFLLPEYLTKLHGIGLAPPVKVSFLTPVRMLRRKQKVVLLKKSCAIFCGSSRSNSITKRTNLILSKLKAAMQCYRPLKRLVHRHTFNAVWLRWLELTPPLQRLGEYNRQAVQTMESW